MIFEGEYLNGKPNGKGKEYDGNGNLLFDGEYLNGQLRQLNVNGKVYTYKDEVEYESEDLDYIDYKRWNRKGKEYNLKGELIFEGEYFKGRRWNGKGKEYNDNGQLIFEGLYIKGKKK